MSILISIVFFLINPLKRTTKIICHSPYNRMSEQGSLTKPSIYAKTHTALGELQAFVVRCFSNGGPYVG